MVSAVESAVKTRPGLVPQPHGGALYAGGVPGNPGGSKPPSALRARLRGSLNDRVKVLEEIADDAAATASDRIRAVDVLAKYGLGAATDLSVDQVRGKLQQTVDLIRERVPVSLAEPLLEEMKGVWLA